LLQTVYPEIAITEDEQSRRWAQEFAALGELLGVDVSQSHQNSLPAVA
jgi:hypothetical protein